MQSLLFPTKIFQIFQRLQKIASARWGQVQFVVFEKFAITDLFQIAPEKSYDYLLIIYK